MFPELVARIEKDSGAIVEYHVQQNLLPVFDEDEAAIIKAGGERSGRPPASTLTYVLSVDTLRCRRK